MKNKAIERQYHTYFSWKEKNANAFFGLFGESFKNEVTIEINQSEPLKLSMKGFMELAVLEMN